MLTRRQLAALKDLPGQAGAVHMQTVTKWEREGMPVAQRGRRGRPSRYRETDVRGWLAAREAAAKSGTALDLAQARAQKEHWQGLLAEQTHRARAGELHDAADCEREQFEFARMVRDRILNVPDRLVGLGPIAQAQLRAALREALGELADELEGPAADSRQKEKGR